MKKAQRFSSLHLANSARKLDPYFTQSETVNTLILDFVSMHKSMHVCMCACVHVCMCVYVCICV